MRYVNCKMLMDIGIAPAGRKLDAVGTDLRKPFLPECVLYLDATRPPLCGNRRSKKETNVDNKKRLTNKQRAKKPAASEQPAVRASGRTREEKSMAAKEADHKMREILLLRRDALRKALAGDLSTLMELREQTAGDTIDQALDSAHHELNSQLAEVESRELANIENALERMNLGQYGVCEGCEEKIPFARISALPYATLCIECQRVAERDGTATGMEFMDWGRLVDGGGGGGDDLSSINDIEIDVS